MIKRLDRAQAKPLEIVSARTCFKMLLTPILALYIASVLPASLASPIHSHHPYQTFPNTDHWPLATVGRALQQQLPDEELQSILAQVSQTNIEATVRKLASFGTRHTLSSQTDLNRGIGAARTWLTARFQEAADASEGRMTISWNSFIKYPGDNERIIFPVNITNVVATLKGSDDPDRLFVTGGHYDSRNSNPIDYQGDAPGAVDESVSPDNSQVIVNVHNTNSTQRVWSCGIARIGTNLCALQA